MSDLNTFLKSLISAPGLSGHEEPVRRLIQAEWRSLVDEIRTGGLGSLQALRRGTGPEPRPSLLLAAHMDAIGMVVARIEDGYLRFSHIGGIDPRVLPGQLVTVHGREDLTGVIASPPDRLLPESLSGKTVPKEHLVVDTGLLPAEVEAVVRVGDLISFAQEPVELSEDVLFGRSLDNRASVAAVTYTLQALQKRALYWDIWAVATVQEEVSLGGAWTSSYGLRPTLALAIDVTFAEGPGSPSHQTYEMEKGLTLGWGPNNHPQLYREFQELAGRLEIPVQMEVMPRQSGTDAMALEIAREGIPTLVLGIPIRYMHTPVELISMKNVVRVGRLIAEFAAGLDADFMDRLRWED